MMEGYAATLEILSFKHPDGTRWRFVSTPVRAGRLRDQERLYVDGQLMVGDTPLLLRTCFQSDGEPRKDGYPNLGRVSCGRVSATSVTLTFDAPPTLLWLAPPVLHGDPAFVRLSVDQQRAVLGMWFRTEGYIE